VAHEPGGPLEETVEHTHDIIALVGADASGTELLESLLNVPGIEVRYVVVDDPDAPAIALGREHGIRCLSSGELDVLTSDADLDLIVDTTGDPAVLAALTADMRVAARVLAAAGARLLLGLAARERETVARLERELAAGELRIAELTETVEQMPTEKACYVRQASHQIKSPLSSIQSYVNVLLGGYAGELPDRAHDIVEKIHTRCEAALDALAKRRTLANLRCIGPDGLEMRDVSLNELVGRVVESHLELAATRGIEISFDRGDAPDLVRCDPDTMTMLLSELVENAVIYSPDGGLVEIAVASHDDGRPAVTVSDQGIGIPERCLTRIFDEDFRTDTAKKHHPDAAGVGLTIARETADLHGASITVESDEGQGSMFTLTLPPAPTA
jgi:signal transduction histidine kinase